jgi:hypothetical protein
MHIYATCSPAEYLVSTLHSSCYSNKRSESMGHRNCCVRMTRAITPKWMAQGACLEMRGAACQRFVRPPNSLIDRILVRILAGRVFFVSLLRSRRLLIASLLRNFSSSHVLWGFRGLSVTQRRWKNRNFVTPLPI